MKNTFKLGRTNNYAGFLFTSSEYRKICHKCVEQLMHNLPKWPDTLQKSCSMCRKIFIVCLTISEHHPLKG